MDEREGYQPVYSCSQTPSCCQIISYCTVTAVYVIFMAGIQPYLSDSSRITLLVLVHLSLLCLVLSALYISLKDPVDPNIPKYLNQGVAAFEAEQLQQLFFCDSCRSYVGQSAKHCRVCNRCVSNFDHHCMWVNNCVGQSNYQVFVVMVVACVALFVLFVSAVGEASGGDWRKYLGGMVVGWVALVVIVPFIVLLAILLTFHIFLIINGKTTYEFLVERRERQLEEQIKQHQQGQPNNVAKLETTVEQFDKGQKAPNSQPPPPPTQLTQSKALRLLLGDQSASKPVEVKRSRLYRTVEKVRDNVEKRELFMSMKVGEKGQRSHEQ